MRRSLFAVCALFALTACAEKPAPVPATPLADSVRPLILISLDGFRADYLKRGLTPRLAALAQGGVTTAGMIPSFPSITFPNHYAIVTGRRPDRNGIVGNTMKDPAIPGALFKLSAHDVLADPRWWGQGQPVWVTAEQHGRRAATMFWPGSETAIDGVRPTRYLAFDKRMASDDRAEKLLSWVDEVHPSFSTLYLNAPDSAGHEYGPDSRELNAALVEVDHAVGILIDGLNARHIKANVIVLADHGMAAIGDGQVIALSDILPAGSADVVTSGAYAGIDPHDARAEQALLAPHGHMQCWRKGDLPARFHYGQNPRVPGVICLAQTGWVIEKTAYRGAHPDCGTHGYDPIDPAMAALFIANGPAFASARIIAPFDNVDVYPLMAALLHVPAEANDGTLAPFTSVLIPENVK